MNRLAHFFFRTSRILVAKVGVPLLVIGALGYLGYLGYSQLTRERPPQQVRVADAEAMRGGGMQHNWQEDRAESGSSPPEATAPQYDQPIGPSTRDRVVSTNAVIDCRTQRFTEILQQSAGQARLHYQMCLDAPFYGINDSNARCWSNEDGTHYYDHQCEVLDILPWTLPVDPTSLPCPVGWQPVGERCVQP